MGIAYVTVAPKGLPPSSLVTMKIGVIGAGNIGRTLRVMLASVDGVTAISLGDNAARGDLHVDVATGENLATFVREHDAIVNALPFYLNRPVASACAEAGRSYFDFSEDIESTAFVSDLARDEKRIVFAPQCGLAPGAVNIIGAHLIAQFDTARSLELRVGALPVSASNEMKYYLSWSSSGLVNEYIKPCDALYRGEPIKTLPLEGKENVVIDGATYEAFNTSGGVATMCDTYRGRISELNYKTIRYPGHLDHMRFVIHDLGLGDRPDLLTQIFDQSIPATRQDVVLLYVNALGTRSGKLQQCSYVKKIKAQQLFPATAIRTTTAAGMAAVVELFIRGALKPGFVRQEEIPFDKFVMTKWGAAVYAQAESTFSAFRPAG
jgi:saccharopine dehydrogenase-like NADP-dependent oxidoreductase